MGLECRRIVGVFYPADEQELAKYKNSLLETVTFELQLYKLPHISHFLHYSARKK